MKLDEVRVWDPLVRLFHWGLAAAFAVAYFTQEQAYDPHLLAGYLVLGLVVFRIVWGFAGTRHARFSDFVVAPSGVVAYLRALVAGNPARYLGHNPAGGAMILALLAALLVVTLSGIALDAAENRAGPLGSTSLFRYGGIIEQTHTLSTNVALVLIGLHLAGVLHAGLVHRENLVRAMLTGRKRA